MRKNRIQMLSRALLFVVFALSALMSVFVFSGFKLSDLTGKLDKNQDNYEVKNSQQATGVRGLGDENSGGISDVDASNVEIPYTEVSSQELVNFRNSGMLK